MAHLFSEPVLEYSEDTSQAQGILVCKENVFVFWSMKGGIISMKFKTGHNFKGYIDV